MLNYMALRLEDKLINESRFKLHKPNFFRYEILSNFGAWFSYQKQKQFLQ